VRASEISELVDSTRSPEPEVESPEEIDSHAHAGAEIAALLGSEPPPPGSHPPSGRLPKSAALSAMPDLMAGAKSAGSQTGALSAAPGSAAPGSSPSASAPFMPGAPVAGPVHPDGPLAITPVPGSFSAEAAFAVASLGSRPGPTPSSTATPTPAPQGAVSMVTVAIAVGAATILAVVLGVVLFSSKGGSGSGAGSEAEMRSGGIVSAQSSAAWAPPGPVPSAASTAQVSAAPAAPSSPEAEARAALARLREGIGACVRDVIALLPGTAPAVPNSFALMKGGVYKSLPRDFRSPVYICAKYKETEPQRFQIQWQLVTSTSEGRGVAWLDDDGDGKADRAFSFKATLVKKNEADLGEIERLDPVPPVVKTVERPPQK
jgi:hypothetical protein